MPTVDGQSTDPGLPGILGTPMNVNVPTTQAIGVKGDGGSGFPSPSPQVPGRTAIGVLGTSADAHGVGVWAENTAGGTGVYGRSKGGAAGQFDGNLKVNGNASISGTDPIQPGVLGTPMNIPLPGTQAIGVMGDGGSGFPSPSPNVPGRTAIGVLGTSADAHGVGVKGENTAGGIGVYGKSNGGIAGQFDGALAVNGDHSVSGTLSVVKDIVLSAADCAEEFDVREEGMCEPGSVMVLGERGVLQAACSGYDKRVAGVISGAGAYRPGLILDKVASMGKRMPIALMGKVYCKVDAQYGPVELGDLLTTSPTPGHAMKAGDPLRAFGAVIGKALRPLEDGRGLIPILVALQ